MRKAGIRGGRGKHDLMVLGQIPPSTCGPRGRRAAEWTARRLSAADRGYLESLPAQIRQGEELLFLHSRVGDPVSRLQLPSDFGAEQRFLRQQYPRLTVCFTGHTHEQMAIEITPAGGFRRLAGDAALDPAAFCFVNPGSVGEPRSND